MKDVRFETNVRVEGKNINADGFYRIDKNNNLIYFQYNTDEKLTNYGRIYCDSLISNHISNLRNI